MKKTPKKNKIKDVTEPRKNIWMFYVLGFVIYDNVTKSGVFTYEYRYSIKIERGTKKFKSRFDFYIIIE